jgi:hypothetical protein
MAVFLTSRIAASQFRDVAGFRLPVDARRHMRPLRPGILFIAVQENSGLKKQPNPLPNISKADSKLAQASDGYQRQQIRQTGRPAFRKARLISCHFEIKDF